MNYSNLTTPHIPTPQDSHSCTCSKTILMVLNPLNISHHWDDLFPDPELPHEGTPLERFPFHCLRCRKSIAFQAFHLHPVQLEMLQDQVYEWSQQYFAIEHLRQGSYLEWADAQLTDPLSPVNALGLEICADLEVVRNGTIRSLRWIAYTLLKIGRHVRSVNNYWKCLQSESFKSQHISVLV